MLGVGLVLAILVHDSATLDDDRRLRALGGDNPVSRRPQGLVAIAISQGVVALEPTSAIALDGHRHPITETGILIKLLGQIRAFTEKNLKEAGCAVDAIPGASVNDRKATCIRVCFPVNLPQVKAYLSRVFVDNELQLPIRYESYEWPRAAGAAPVLLEEFTYLNLKLNPGFTDADFDPKNQNYAFP
jgi:hypothetical protein